MNKEYVIDLECDGLTPTRIHCLSIDDCNGKAWTLVESKDIIDFFDTLDSTDRVIGHNFIRFDAVVLKNLLNIDIKAGIADTTALSWYLYPSIVKHGLAFWGERLGIKKPVVEDWDDQPIEVYIERCEEDVKINLALWIQMKEYLDKLYAGKDSDKIIKYLAHKMNCAAMQELSKWKLCTHKATVLEEELLATYKIAVDDLASVMPKVDKKAKRNKPAKPYKKDGSLSATGEKWDMLTKENDLPFDYNEDITVVVGQNEPNPSSVPQLKSWLTKLGWIPETYTFKPEGGNIPQIKKPDGSLCESIERLIKVNPELQHLSNMTVVKHRIGVVQGLIKNTDSDGFVKARIQGLTNTLRFKHAVCVNLPSERKPYGKELRSLFTVRKSEHTLCGSDMSSLEDRTKQHYMWDYDPEYVKDMTTEGFDPHLDLALSAGAVTEEQVDQYKSGDKTPEISQIRHNYKGGNYACTYGAGLKTLARQLNISEGDAGKIHKAYWKRNWSLKKIAKDAEVRTVDGQLWLWNPVSQLYYFLKAEKDKFSTLNQGTGTYCFDIWLGFIIRKRKQLTAQFHDEIILEVQESKQEDISKMLEEAMCSVNKNLKLNRDLACDISFGKDYAKIH